ncbi:MAG: hypothetical protein ACYC0Q_08295 [Eubacteriales bacterium]
MAQAVGEENLFVINPGSTSTKIGFFRGDKNQWIKNVLHSANDLAAFSSITKQLPYRLDILRLVRRLAVNL